jgi:CheY-like chemotaxis protein
MMLESAVILLVEDDPADVELTQYTIQKSKVLTDLHVASDGVEALAFLRREGKYADAPRPDLILLDLNMPRMDGRTFLVEMRADEKLKSIPVVVLTTSHTDEDILKSYQVGANCYITKPVGLQEFIKVVNAIEEFWFTIVRLPKGSESCPA